MAPLTNSLRFGGLLASFKEVANSRRDPMKRTTLAIAIAALAAGMSASALAQDAPSRDALNDEAPASGAGEQPGAMTNADSDTSPEADTSGDERDLMSRTISDVEGMSVVNLEEEEIGDVDRVVEHNDSGELYAIVTLGGFWGFGGTDIALPISDMQLNEDDQLVMQTPYGKDEIESSTEEYDEENYTQIDSDMTLNEVASHPR